MLKIFLSAFYLLAFLFLGRELSKSYIHKPEFLIKNISISGEYSLVKDELSKLSGEIYGKNTWEISLDKIKDRLKKDVRISDVQIYYSDLGEVKIKIKEKKMIYYGNMVGKTYMLDSDGIPFAFINEGPSKSVPIIFGKNEEELKECLNLFSKIKDEYLSQGISEIRYNSPYEITLLLDRNTLVKTQKEVPEKKYIVLKQLYFDLIKEKKIEYIDLRFDGYIVKERGVD